MGKLDISSYVLFRDTAKMSETHRLFIILLKSKNSKAKLCRILFHYSQLLITSKDPKADLVKSEEIISKPQRLTPLGLWGE